MKKIVIATILIICSVTVKSQYKFSSLMVTEGKSAMTSGIDFTITITGPNNTLYMAQSNNERANIRFGKYWGKSDKKGQFTAMITGGFFKNVPWAGPIFNYEYKWLNLFSWSGVGMAKDKHLELAGWNPNFFFTYEEVRTTFGNNQFAYGFMIFTTYGPSHYVVYKRIMPIGDFCKFFAEGTYDICNDDPLFVLGLSKNF